MNTDNINTNAINDDTVGESAQALGAMPEAAIGATESASKEAKATDTGAESVADITAASSANEASDTEASEAATATEAEKKPRRRRKKANGEGAVAEEGEKKPTKPRKKRVKEPVAEVSSAVEAETAPDAAEEKPKRPRRSRKKATDEVTVETVPEEAFPIEAEPSAACEDGEALPSSDIVESVAEVLDADLVVPDEPNFDGIEEISEPEVDILGDPISERGEEVAEASEDEGISYEPRPLSKREPKYDEEKPRRVDFLFDFIELFVFTLVAVLVITTFFVRHSVVEGTSMESTLREGDVLIISDLFYTPARGDIVVVQDTSTILKKPIVKRVIGLGGEVIRVARDGIYINGEKLEEEYVYTDNLPYTYHNLPTDELVNYEGFSLKFEEVDGRQLLLYYEFVIPEGELFVMGDHRNVSTDSRAIGTVKEDSIIGRVLFRLLPFDVFGKVE